MSTQTAHPEAQPATLQAVLEHQTSVMQAQQGLQRLQGLKVSHQDKVAHAEQVDRSLRDMSVQMQDLMADIESGEDKRQELDGVRERYAAACESLGDASYDKADDVLAGLDRKIERAQASLKALQEKRPALMRAMLMDQAEAIGAEYAEAALKMIDLYRRLLVMGYLLAAHGRIQSLFTGAGIEVPLFELDSVRPHADFHSKGHILRGRFMRGQLMKTEAAERQRIAALGVDLAVAVDGE